MVKSVYVPEAGGNINFADDITPQEMSAYLNAKYPRATAPAPAASGPDDSSILDRVAYGLGTSFTDVPGGIASLMYPASREDETWGGRFSRDWRLHAQKNLNIDPTKDPTTAQMLAQGVGSVLGFAVPGGAVAKGAGALGAGVRAAGLAGTAAVAGQGVALGAEQRAEQIRQQIAGGMQISEEQQLAAQRLSGLIGASDALPMHKFFEPIGILLRKVPASKAGLVEKIIQNRMAKVATAGFQEGAQEAASGIANDLMEYGIYNPDVEIGQDIMSNAGTGAFAGGLLEGVIQLAAGRKMARFKQLKDDLAAEGKANMAELNQASIAQGAEALRNAGIEGRVSIEENEDVGGQKWFTVVSPSGKPIVDMPDLSSATSAVDMYKAQTGAKVEVASNEAPKMTGVRIGGRRFQTIEQADAQRLKLKKEVKDLADYQQNFELVSRHAALAKQPPKIYAKKIDDDLRSKRAELARFDAYFETTPTGPQPVAPAPSPDAVTTPQVDAVEPPQADSGLSETPSVEGPMAEQPVTEEAVAEAPAEEGVPESFDAPKDAPVIEEVLPEDVTPDAIIGAADEASGIDVLPDTIVDEVTQPENVSAEVPTQEEATKGEGEEPKGAAMSAGPVEPRPAPTLREAAAAGPTIRDYTPETAAWMQNVYKGVYNRVESILPDKVKLQFKTLIEGDPGLLIRGSEEGVDTQYGIKSVIDLSTGILKPGMSVEEAVNKLVDTVNHELIHAIVRQGVLRPNEWKMLLRAAETTKLPGKKYTYLDKAQAIYAPNGVPIRPIYANPEVVAEEAVADMYRDWVRGLKGLNEKPVVQPGIRGLLNRITEFFRRIFQTLRNAGHDKVFQNIESGEVGSRKLQEKEAQLKSKTAESKFSAAPALGSEEFNGWFGRSKIVNEDGSPKVVYHGTKTAFDEFDTNSSELGAHFGNQRQASEFVEHNPETFINKDLGDDYTVEGRSDQIFPVYLSIQNPIRMTDEGAWGPSRTARQLRRMGVISEAELESVKGLSFRDGIKRVQDILRQKGHDGVVYLNRREGLNRIPDEVERVDYEDNMFQHFFPEAEDSYIVFEPQQVKSIFNTFEKGAAESKKFSASPLPQYVEEQNGKIFADTPKINFKDMMLNNVSEFIFGHAGKVAVVDKAAYMTHIESELNKAQTGNYQRMQADYSATAALAWRRRSGHIMASMMLRGKLTLSYDRPGDIMSATMKVENDPDSLKEVFKVMTEPAGEGKTKADIFKSYAVARRGEWLRSTGQPVPSEITPQYIREVTDFTRQNYPEVIEAYNKYQRFNKNLLTTAKEAGLLSQAELGRLTNQMNYYGFNYEVYGEVLGPKSAQKTASRFKLRAYTGSQRGGLASDPMFVMIQNAQFWVDSIAKNLASIKSYEIARQMGEAKLLGTNEEPDEAEGWQPDIMYFSKDGVVKRFAVKDQLMAVALGSDDRINVGKFWEALGVPSTILRESVTRDPGFMARNLLRDTVSSWITSGADFTPVMDTLKGGLTALKNGQSFQDLSARGVVGSYDLGMMGAKEIADVFRRNAMPLNVHAVTSVEGLNAVTRSLWNRLGNVSEASDAATRIAVYDSLRAKGVSEAEAAMQAIELLDFTRRGASQTLGILTKLIPFLNARIQGMDVLYQAGRSGVRYLSGTSLGERDANVGKKFMVRGAMLAAIAVGLEMLNDGDEDYEQLEDYVKNGNFIVPLKQFGLEGQFLAVPKPFEAGLLFATIPQQIYKTTTGEASTRENAQLFWGQFASTFGVNPIPQAILPAMEVITNHSFYTGLPLISEGKARLAPELQYNTSTSQLAMLIGGLPIFYNFDTGRFGGASPIMIDKLISGYAGPVGTYMVQAVSLAMQDAQLGPDRMPIELSNAPVVKSFFIDAKTKNPKVVTQAYELFRIADEANRTVSRLKQMGDAEALADYMDQNRDILQNKKFIFKLVDRLNKLSAQERAIERDKTMTREQKFAAQEKLRETRIRISSRVDEINKTLGR